MTKEKVKNRLQSVEAVCITTDCWTSINCESFISLTAHFIEESKMTRVLLDCRVYGESHTAVNLSEEIKNVCNEWGVSQKISAIVTDNAANVVAAVKITGWSHVPCFAHTINLIVQHGLKNISSIRKKVKSIVEFFKRSTQASEKLKKMQLQMETQPLKLKQDVSTRWNSTFDMFKRIIDIKDPLMSTIAINYAGLDNISNDDINILQKCCDILEIFKDVT